MALLHRICGDKEIGNMPELYTILSQEREKRVCIAHPQCCGKKAGGVFYPPLSMCHHES